jgi:hypothetical protein
MINRAVLIVRPKVPFLDWAARLDHSGVLPDVEGEQTVYLIPNFDMDDDARTILEEVYPKVFEYELWGLAHRRIGVARKARSQDL